jgi:hypothetical protein
MTTHYNPFISALICLTNIEAQKFYTLQLSHFLVALSTACLFTYELGQRTRTTWNRHKTPKLPPAAPSLLLPPAHFATPSITNPWNEPQMTQTETVITTPPTTATTPLMLPGTCTATLKDLRRRLKIAYGITLPRNATKADALRLALELSHK